MLLPLSSVLIRKLEAFHKLSVEDRALLKHHCQPMREFAAGKDIISQGDTPENVFLILSGFACRYKLTENGDRQIMAYLIPGDFCDFQVFILREMDHSIGTLSPCDVVALPRRVVLELSDRPAIARAFWWASLVDAAILREWLVNIGQRRAEERIAHLLCELLIRLRTVGLVSDDNAFELPITQMDLADTMGITNVHANRMLMSLREHGMIAMSGGSIIVPDLDRLIAFSGFDANYLHLLQTAGVRSAAAS